MFKRLTNSLIVGPGRHQTAKCAASPLHFRCNIHGEIPGLDTLKPIEFAFFRVQTFSREQIVALGDLSPELTEIFCDLDQCMCDQR